jgi:hypothetical protein
VGAIISGTIAIPLLDTLERQRRNLRAPQAAFQAHREDGPVRKTLRLMASGAFGAFELACSTS